MMISIAFVALLVISASSAAPQPSSEIIPFAISSRETSMQHPKRAALVLDRLLVALRQALAEKEEEYDEQEGPRTAPLITDGVDYADVQRNITWEVSTLYSGISVLYEGLKSHYRVVFSEGVRQTTRGAEY